MVTGLDLVRAQLLVASGEPLPFTQADVRVTGHAVECRVYAEDSRRLLPQSGRLLRYREPAGDGVRVDSGVVEGLTISVHYDPLLAKLITHAPTREAALGRARDAIDAFRILGIRHNLAFLRALLDRPEIRSNQTHTRFIEAHLDELAGPPGGSRSAMAAAVAALCTVLGPRQAPAAGDRRRYDPWDLLGPVAW
jgi:acetyl/propionyl-CoA carboxylase alpha subunit